MPILVPDSMPATAVELADLKKHLNMTGPSQDVELEGVLAAAVDLVEGIVGPLTPYAVVEVHSGMASPLVLRESPVISVESVVTGGAAVTGAVLNAEAGLLAIPRCYSPVTVSYTAGRATVPPAVRLAVLIAAAHLWETQRGASPLPLQGSPEFDPGVIGAGYALPNRANELLARYRQSSSVA